VTEPARKHQDRELSQQQQAFVVAYLELRNATQAAIRAGYSEHTADRQGSRLLKHQQIQQAVQQGNRTIHARAIAKMAAVPELQNAIDASESWIVAQAVTIVEAAMDPEVLDFRAAVSALTLLAKRHPAFAAKQEISGPGGGPIPLLAGVMNMTDEQLRGIVAERRGFTVRLPERTES